MPLAETLNYEIIKKQKTLTRCLPLRLSLLVLAADVIAIVFATFASFQLFSVLLMQEMWTFKEWTPPYYYALCLLLVFRSASRGHYTQRVPWWSQMYLLLKLLAGLWLVDGFAQLVTQAPPEAYLKLGRWLVACLSIAAVRAVAWRLCRLSSAWKLPVVIIGDEQIVTDAYFALNPDTMTGYEIKTVLLNTESDKAEALQELRYVFNNAQHVDIVASPQNIPAYIRSHADAFYIISLDGFRGARRDDLMQALEVSGRDYAIIPPMKRLHLYGMEPHYFFGNDIMLLHRHTEPFMSLGKLAKPALDRFAAFCALPFLGLLTLVIWACKKAEGSQSPLFYGGMRVGQGGKLFPCWKYCTMRPDADAVLQSLLDSDPAAKEEWDRYQKLRNDPRIDSRISAILRKTSLDELPQLWNVFMGDMSLVGPRPILPAQKADYGDALPLYEAVKPGLTGLWQVSGRNETSFAQRVVWDKWYVKNWSFWHDVVILIKTIRVFTTGSGAY